MTLSDVLHPQGPWYKRWTVLTLIFGGIVLFGQVIGAFQVIEPFFPAHRGYVDDQVKTISGERDGLATILGKAIDEKFKTAQGDTDAKFNALNSGLYDLQALVLEDRISKLQAELTDIELKLDDIPRDAGLLGRKAALKRQIADNEKLLNQTRCLANPGTAFCSR